MMIPQITKKNNYSIVNSLTSDLSNNQDVFNNLDSFCKYIEEKASDSIGRLWFFKVSSVIFREQGKDVPPWLRHLFFCESEEIYDNLSEQSVEWLEHVAWKFNDKDWRLFDPNDVPKVQKMFNKLSAQLNPQRSQRWGKIDCIDKLKKFIMNLKQYRNLPYAAPQQAYGIFGNPSNDKLDTSFQKKFNKQKNNQ